MKKERQAYPRADACSLGAFDIGCCIDIADGVIDAFEGPVTIRTEVFKVPISPGFSLQRQTIILKWNKKNMAQCYCSDRDT